MAPETLDFDDYAPVEIPVKYLKRNFLLREATGGDANAYRRASLSGVEMVHDDDANLRTTKNLDGVASVETLLVSLCLYAEDAGHPGKFTDRVTEDFVKAMPSPLQKRLFDKAKEISDLGETGDLESLKKQRDKLDRRIAKLERDRDPKARETGSTSSST